MNENQKHSFNDESESSLESLLGALRPVEVQAPMSDGQMMYEMGRAAGLAEANERSVSLPSNASQYGFWKVAALVASVLAVTFGALLLADRDGRDESNRIAQVEADSLRKNVVENNEDPIDFADLNQEVMQEPENSYGKRQASVLHTLFGTASAESPLVRRQQILAIGTSSSLDRSLEQIFPSAARSSRRHVADFDLKRGRSAFEATRQLLESEVLRGL